MSYYSSLIVDYDEFFKNKKLEKCKNFPKGSFKYQRGVLFIIPKEILKKLEQSDDKIGYCNSKEFIKNVKEYYYIFYGKEELCYVEICDESNNIETAINSLDKEFDNIVISIPIKERNFKKCTHTLLKNSYIHPHISNISPFGEPIKHSVLLTKKDQTNYKFDQLVQELEYLLQQYKNDTCNLYARFDNEAIKFLKGASYKGFSKNKDGKVTQKEIGGILRVKRIEDNVVVIGADEKSASLGEEESVNVSMSRYNFHSHPKEAYVRHSVKKAWPSIVDYNGFMKLGKNTIFHCVATIEGIYILSFTSHWVDKLKSIPHSFINKNFDISHSFNYTPYEYVRKVNSIKYKGKPIFIVKFLPWENADSIFSISFGKDGLNCFYKEESLDNYNSIYSDGDD